MKNKKILLPVVVFVFIFFVVGAFLLFANESTLQDIPLAAKYSCYLNSSYADEEHHPQSDDVVFGEEVPVKIQSGEGVDSIAEKLKERDLLSDADYFTCYIKKNKLDSTIQAGYFELPNNLSIADLAIALQDASIPTVNVTVPEGLMIIEIADIWAQKLVGEKSNFNKEEFLSYTRDPEFIKQVDFVTNPNSLEGYLFPDTYNVSLDVTAVDVINLMLDTFETKVMEQYSKDINSSKHSLSEIMTIASLVEREERDPEYMRYVSDIIIRRLEMNWTLGIDASLLYYYKDWKHPLTQAELAEDQPYNTRMNPGLPPTPICNPGIDAIKSTLFPEPNEYLYYLHDKDGKIHFAKDGAEHNANIQKYLR